MNTTRLVLSCLAVVILLGGPAGVTGEARVPSNSFSASQSSRQHPALDERSRTLRRAAPQGQHVESECDPSLMALLPALGGPGTGPGCRSLDEVAFTLANPDEAALDLSAWGWQETAYISSGEPSDGATLVSVHRFATVEGAEKALDAFGSIANQPAGVSAVDPADLNPNQRGLTEGWWAALVEQDGVLVTRVSTITLWFPEGSGPIIQYPLSIMESLRTSWASGEPPNPSGLGAYQRTTDPGADSKIAAECLISEHLACAKEFFESAYLSSPDRWRSDLYRFYVVSGDMWQTSGELDRALQDYGAAHRVDSLQGLAEARLTHLEDYVAVELFDPFATFGYPFVAVCAPVTLFVDGTWVAGRATSCEHGPGSGRLDIQPEAQGWEAVHWPHTPQSADYAVAADVESIGLSTTIGLNLAHSDATGGFSFMVDPDTEEWWIEGQTTEGSWAKLVRPAAVAGRGLGRASRLEVRVNESTPSFFINGSEVSAGVDLSWLSIPRTGDAGIVVENSATAASTPPSASFTSFGIYALDPGGATEDTSLDLQALLPTLGDVPSEMVLIEEGGRGVDEIIRTFPDPADAARNFTEWGWQENAYRDFESSNRATAISVSLHRFADPESAAEALPYLAEARAILLELAPIAVSRMGDQVEAIEGGVTGGYEASVYVQRGDVVARVTVTVTLGDPLPLALETAAALFGSVDHDRPDPEGARHRG